jgi:catechol 2,3-dioxygenase-like lactoylglutathione lyase family enzyme
MQRFAAKESAMLSKSPVAATLPVRDLEAAKLFYEERLGLTLQHGSVAEGFLEFEAGAVTCLLLFESAAAETTGNTVATFEVKDLRDEMTALRSRGVRFEEYDLPHCKTVDGVANMDGHVMAWVEDPHGHVLALHQQR